MEAHPVEQEQDMPVLKRAPPLIVILAMAQLVLTSFGFGLLVGRLGR